MKELKVRSPETDKIVESLREGRAVKVSHLGRFTIIDVNFTKLMHDISKGRKRVLKGYKKIKFRPTRGLKVAVKNLP